MNIYDLPQTIQDMFIQMGGGKMSGAMIYCGVSKWSYTNIEREKQRNSFVTPSGAVDTSVGIIMQVNGKRGAGWRIIVSYELSDTYTVRLWRKATPTEEKKDIFGVVLYTEEDVYCDMLQNIIEQMYDQAIREHNKGFVPI